MVAAGGALMSSRMTTGGKLVSGDGGRRLMAEVLNE